MRKKPVIISFIAVLLATMACSGAAEALPEPTDQPVEQEAQPTATQEPSQQERSVDTAAPEPTATPEPTPTEEVIEGPLPAPLYYVSADDGQIYRMERDGVTTAQVTFEPSPVTALTVSAEAERVAYVSNNSLYMVDLFGAGRTLIAQGDANVETYDFANSVGSPAWSPDGTQLAYGDGGFVLYDVATDSSTMVLASDQPPDFSDDGQNQRGGDPNDPPVAVRPISWSPDGAKMLINEAIYNSDGIGVSVYDFETGSITPLRSPDGIVCCDPTWTPDSSSIIISSDTAGFIAPGMWRIDTTTGEGERLIQGTPEGDTDAYTLVFGAQQLADGAIYRFQETVEGFPESQTALLMLRSNSDTNQFSVLHEEEYIPGAILWDPQATGGVMMDLTEQYEVLGFPDFPFRGPLIWMPADGSDPIPLNVEGGELAWGG